jgi:hypothetical protein
MARIEVKEFPVIMKPLRVGQGSVSVTLALRVDSRLRAAETVAQSW